MTEEKEKKIVPMDERIKQRIYGAVRDELAALHAAVALLEQSIDPAGAFTLSERTEAVRTFCQLSETMAAIKTRCESSCIETELMVQTAMASLSGLMNRSKPGEQATSPTELVNLIRRASRPGGQQQVANPPDTQRNDDKPGV